ncbi:MAG TPA: hypothetical protein VFX02_09730 [Gammaproteobacteria bacterium]|nr:hypothetical protein [Gammaproteobacteria bacterium]
MRNLLKLYDSARFVATLWILAPLLAVALITRDEKVAWMPYVAAFLILVIVVSIVMLRRDRIRAGKWGYSDVAAYIAVPSVLFMFFLVVFLSQPNP